MKKIFLLNSLFVVLALSGCSSEYKTVCKKSKLFTVREVGDINNISYEVGEVVATENYKAKIEEKADYIVITPKDAASVTYKSLGTVPSESVNSYLDVVDKYYYPGKKSIEVNLESLIYYDVKFGLQALSIPLKFRRSVGNDTINPPTVETGINIGFAPGWKFTKNIYKPTKNFLGKNTTQIAFVVGPHLGLGATDLKKASNAPGLLSDRKGPVFTGGGYIMFGFNNINLGFAIGKDYVIGEGHDEWVYQGKTWTGVIVSLDILKF